MNVTIVDYQSGNISSVINSFTEVAKGKVNLEVTSDIKKIKSYAKNSGSKILTTEKDYSKLDKNDVKGINYLSIDLFIKNENKFIKFINSKI